MKNIEAVKEISSMTRTSMGPNGMNKLIINHLDKVFLTKDTGVMCKELDINHPAAKLIVNASKMQENEQGDNTNFVLTFAGEALNLAGQLIKAGNHPSDILIGYERAWNKTLELLDEAPKYTVNDLRNHEEVTKIIKAAIGSKTLQSQEQILSTLIAQACINVVPSKAEDINVENVRVAKILGGSLVDSTVIKGLVVVRLVEGRVTHAENCKVAVFNVPLETQGLETKDTVVFKSADELINYTRSEEDHMEKIVKEIVDSGVKAVIVGGSISDMAIHFLDKYGILVFRIMSKFELRRIAKAIGATLLVRLGAPTKEEMGYADKIYVDEISSQKCIVLVRDSDENKLSTIVVRGSTNNMLENIERIVEDGVNVYKSACKDQKFLAGAGAIEMYLSNGIKQFGKTVTSLDQYSIAKFGEAFEVVPRTLAENSGLNVNEVIANLYGKITEDPAMGIDVNVSLIILKIYLVW
jgi:T-complex protein 1 subunit theta